jgi:Zn finger protein HypA/HybF involved in hydrogenase expression
MLDITKDPIEFRCPHCKKVILTCSKDNPSKETTPNKCPKCEGEIDNTGAQPYTNNKE